MILKVFMSVVETFIIFGFGIYVWKRKMIMPEDLNKLSKLTLDFFFPLLTFSTITRTYDPDRLQELWIMPVAGLGLMIFGGLLGIFLKRFMRNSRDERIRVFHHICAVNNYVFLPLIVLQNIYSERHVALLLTMNVGATIGFWTVGVVTLQKNSNLRDSLKGIWSINLVAVFAALLWSVLGIPMPSALANAMRSVGNMSVPFMLLIIGIALAQCYKSVLADKLDIIYLSLTRLVLIPLAVLAVLRLLPLPRDIYEVLLVVSLMPAASSSVLVAGRYGGSVEFTGQAIIVTTLLSLLTIPLMMHFFG